ncbi:MAG TPA: diacylglycerol kinase family protein [Bryobacteraceae bacterium]|nr:diacylglycerol kinase family protein [Bryobacteraceae bacterium]
MGTSTLGRAKVFVNASSGFDAKEDAPERLRNLFADAGIDADIEYVRAGVNLAEKSREAVASGADFVVAGGGDGTLSATASALAGSDACFGVLPVGTLNHFARDLNLPLDLQAAAEIVVNGDTTSVDVAEVNGKIFLNNSIIGLYPIYRFLKAKYRRLALLMGALAVFRRLPSLNVVLHVDGEAIQRRTSYILVGNNEHGMDGYNLGFRESLTEGKLWIYVMKERGRWGLLALLLRLVTGRFHGPDDFEIFPAQEVRIEANRGKKIGVALDGEIAVMETPLHYRILPRALKVRVPKGR